MEGSRRGEKRRRFPICFFPPSPNKLPFICNVSLKQDLKDAVKGSAQRRTRPRTTEEGERDCGCRRGPFLFSFPSLLHHLQCAFGKRHARRLVTCKALPRAWTCGGLWFKTKCRATTSDCCFSSCALPSSWPLGNVASQRGGQADRMHYIDVGDYTFSSSS